MIKPNRAKFLMGPVKIPANINKAYPETKLFRMEVRLRADTKWIMIIQTSEKQKPYKRRSTTIIKAVP